MIGSHAAQAPGVRSSGDIMWRTVVISSCLLTGWIGAAGADPAPYHWSPTFYQAGTMHRTASGGRYSGFLLTCAPTSDEVRLRFVTDSFAVEADAETLHALDIDVDAKRFRIGAQVVADDGTAGTPALLSGPIDPAIVAALTRALAGRAGGEP